MTAGSFALTARNGLRQLRKAVAFSFRETLSRSSSSQMMVTPAFSMALTCASRPAFSTKAWLASTVRIFAVDRAETRAAGPAV